MGFFGSKKDRRESKALKKFIACKRCNPHKGQYCGKHIGEAKREAKEFNTPSISLYDDQGRNRNGIRYDARGKRVWD